jgi:hypothetical protein
MTRKFKMIGDELTFGGVTVAHMDPGVSASLRDELDTFFDGLTLDVVTIEDAAAEAAEAAGEAAAQYSGAYDDGYREGYDAGRRNYQGQGQ